jgi:hypothetical protein
MYDVCSCVLSEIEVIDIALVAVTFLRYPGCQAVRLIDLLRCGVQDARGRLLP